MTTAEKTSTMAATPFAQWATPGFAALRRFMLSDWAPQSLALLGVLAVLVLSLGAVANHQLQLIASLRSARAEAIQRPSVASLLGSQDFTLSPDTVRQLSQDDARAFNAGIPFSTLPILAAKPFIMTPDKIEEYARALDCLTAAVYFEAASETGPGQAAVAQVVLNRMRHPAYPKTVCGVVFEGSQRATGCQFSFTCDGAMLRTPSIEGWARARATAAAALNGSVAAEVGMATHYHTDWVAPYWAAQLIKMKQIGAHIFYRWSGSWGLPAAFTGRHGGVEPVIPQMALVTTPLDPLALAEPMPVDPALDEPSVIVEIARPGRPPVIETPALASEPEPIAAAAAPLPAVPPPPPMLANPLAPPTAAAPARRSRIAAPSSW